MRGHPPAAGITLIELLVTLAIVAVVITIVGPSVGTVVDRVRLRSLANDVISEARYARNAAETSGRTTWMTFDEEGIHAAGERLLETPQNVTLTADPPLLMFLTTGQVVGPERIELRTTAGRLEVLVRDPVTGNLRRNEPTDGNR